MVKNKNTIHIVTPSCHNRSRSVDGTKLLPLATYV